MLGMLKVEIFQYLNPRVGPWSRMSHDERSGVGNLKGSTRALFRFSARLSFDKIAVFRFFCVFIHTRPTYGYVCSLNWMCASIWMSFTSLFLFFSFHLSCVFASLCIFLHFISLWSLFVCAYVWIDDCNICYMSGWKGVRIQRVHQGGKRGN